MARYVIGDLQGCFAALECLLAKLDFSPSRDEVWLAGDLVNRGPDSLACLRWVREHAAGTVLGNHDLHLLAVFFSDRVASKRKDTLQGVLAAPDCADLMHWLRQQPVFIYDAARDEALVHAGVPHIWSMAAASEHAEALHAVLRSEAHGAFFDEMYGNQPAQWSEALTGMTRLRVITNYFTRMRFIQADGTLDFAAKEGRDAAPSGFTPWFEVPRADKSKIIFGHWAALEGHTGSAQFVATDTGCVWGGALTALNTDTGERVSCAC